jgi:hypothetical protein
LIGDQTTKNLQIFKKMNSDVLLADLTHQAFANLNDVESLYFRKQQLQIEKELSPLDQGDIKNLLLFWSTIDLFKSIKMGLTDDFVALGEIKHPELNLAHLIRYLAEQEPKGKTCDSLFEPIVIQLAKLNNVLLFAHYFAIFAIHSQKTKPKPSLLKSIFKL